MRNQAYKVVLPSFLLTEVASSSDPLREEVLINGGIRGSDRYFRKPVINERRPSELARLDLLPLVLRANGEPWAEACMWLLTLRLEDLARRKSSNQSIADDMAAYLRFVEETDIDWMDFPSQKYLRPTYKFHARLKLIVENREMAGSTAKRRMGSVIRFYRWLIEEGLLSPDNPPWRESDRYIEFVGEHGERSLKKVVTTDVSLKLPVQDDPYDGCIVDGGKLRPLSYVEQEWIINSLLELGNVEMTLIHLVAILTGARIQTILTLRVGVFLKNGKPDVFGNYRLPIGPGTMIDTKNNKKMVLHIPYWLYEKLKTYVLSDRSKRRRLRSVEGDIESQYLFLSIRGTPMYEARNKIGGVQGNLLRHRKVGQGVRQYMADYVIPHIRKKYSHNFSYRFHDLRATFGMNLVDGGLKLVDSGTTTVKEVLGLVQARLGHSSISTTERYLNFREKTELARLAQGDWEAKLFEMATAMKI